MGNSPSEKPIVQAEKPIIIPEKLEKALASFWQLSQEISNENFVQELKKKSPKELEKYKIDIRLDFLDMNEYFNPDDTSDNWMLKQKILEVVMPIFNVMNNAENYEDPTMDAFLSKLLPDRSYIQAFMDGEYE